MKNIAKWCGSGLLEGNIDDVRQTRSYYCTQAKTTGFPSGAYQYGHLLSIDISNGYMVVQFYVEDGDDIYFRNRWDGSWRGWRLLAKVV